MNKEQRVKKLYFDDGLKQKDIAIELGISKKYVSKILLKDYRYKIEKEQRKKTATQQHKQKTIDYIKKKRESKNNDIEYAQLKQLHNQDCMELSGGRKSISNRTYRDWNPSIYEYNNKTKAYHLKKGITVGVDVPKKINWTI